MNRLTARKIAIDRVDGMTTAELQGWLFATGAANDVELLDRLTEMVLDLGAPPDLTGLVEHVLRQLRTEELAYLFERYGVTDDVELAAQLVREWSGPRG